MIVENAPQRIRFDAGDGIVAGWRWPAAGRPPMLFLHANGFCASAYRRMLGSLAGSFDLHALDLRGHGANTRPADPSRLTSWKPYVEDACAYLDNAAREGWILAGHSLGAATSLLAACGRGDVAALRLIEPVAPPEWMTIAARTPFWRAAAGRIPMVRQASRRRNGWPDREAVAASYAAKPLFGAWAPGVLEDYFEDGLVEEGDSVRLACDPAWEAATYAAQANDFWSAARVAPAPVAVLAADHPSSTVPAPARSRLKRLGAAVTLVSGVGHLAPMERPAELAGFLQG